MTTGGEGIQMSLAPGIDARSCVGVFCPWCGQGRWGLVLVVVVAVSGVPVAVVQVVDVVAVGDGLVPAAFAVRMVAVILGDGVGALALIPVAAVLAMDVTIVEVVDMVVVGHAGVTTIGAVGVGVGLVSGAAAHDVCLSLACAMASSAMWVTCWSAIEYAISRPLRRPVRTPA